MLPILIMLAMLAAVGYALVKVLLIPLTAMARFAARLAAGQWRRLTFRQLRRMDVLPTDLIRSRWQDILLGGTDDQHLQLMTHWAELTSDAQLETMRRFVQVEDKPELVVAALTNATLFPENVSRQAVTPALAHPEKEVRQRAFAWARQHFSLEYWRIAVEKSGMEVRFYAAKALADIPEATPLLEQLLADDTMQVQISVVRSLAVAHEPEAGRLLRAFLPQLAKRHIRLDQEVEKLERRILVTSRDYGDADQNDLYAIRKERAALAPLIETTLEALKNYPSCETYLSLLLFAGERFPRAAHLAGQTLAYFGAAAMTELKSGLNDDDPQIRYSSALALSITKSPELKELLTPRLQDDAPAVRMLAFLALQPAAVEQDYEAVAAGLNLPVWNMRKQIYELLTERNNRRFWRLLTANFEAGDEEEQRSIRRILDVHHATLSKHGVRPLNVAEYYCTACRARAVVEKYRHWRGVCCRLCRDSRHLQADVTRVVGYIGPLPEAAPPGELHLALWDEAARKAARADVDEIIIAGGAEISYDWAVNAVLQTQADAGQARTPMRTLGDPPLSENTRRLMEA